MQSINFTVATLESWNRESKIDYAPLKTILTWNQILCKTNGCYPYFAILKKVEFAFFEGNSLWIRIYNICRP